MLPDSHMAQLLQQNNNNEQKPTIDFFFKSKKKYIFIYIYPIIFFREIEVSIFQGYEVWASELFGSNTSTRGSVIGTMTVMEIEY